jgi:hypothetical protein
MIGVFRGWGGSHGYADGPGVRESVPKRGGACAP